MGIVIVLIVVVAFVLLLIFVPFFRGLISLFIRLAFFFAAIFIAIAGAAMLMNNETIFERPGWKLRASRFLTVDWANTSEKGLSDAPCTADGTEARPQSAAPKARPKQQAAQPAPSPTATPAAGRGGEEENVYDELVTRNYICEGDQPTAIPRDKLFQMAQDTINELQNWKLMGAEPRMGLLNCTVTSRVFGLVDDVKIVVTPKSDVAICSQSRVGEPGSTSLIRFFPGDFGANIGHIKQFYAALKPKADLFCKELEEKQKPKQQQR
jgi:hypothetical protein